VTRTLSSTIVSEVTGSVVHPILMSKFEFDSGDLNLFSGYGVLTVDGDSYLGVGELGGISPVVEAGSLKATGVKYSLSSIDSSVIGTALLEDYQDRPVTTWMGFMDGDGTFLDRVIIFQGRMDTMNIQEKGDTSDLSLSAENILIGLEKPNERRFTAEDQKTDYPSDVGFDQVNALQEKEITWGRS
jgi:hypothetical protein